MKLISVENDEENDAHWVRNIMARSTNYIHTYARFRRELSGSNFGAQSS